MPIPAAAEKWPQPMDPWDRVDYLIEMAGSGALLDEGELAASYTLAVPADAAALGLVILEDAPYAPQLLGGDTILLWFEIDEADRENPVFDAGVSIPVTVTVVTTSTPPRRRQRTLVLEVINL